MKSAIVNRSTMTFNTLLSTLTASDVRRVGTTNTQKANMTFFSKCVSFVVFRVSPMLANKRNQSPKFHSFCETFKYFDVISSEIIFQRVGKLVGKVASSVHSMEDGNGSHYEFCGRLI